MTYQIEISPTAIKDIETIFLWLKTNSPNNAYRWARGCYEIMLKLEKFPKRCPLALESQYLDQDLRTQSGVQRKNKPFSLITDAQNNEISFQCVSPIDIEVRQLFYEKQYKILSTVIEYREENSGIVQIHRVRHGSQEIMKTLDQFFSEEET